MQALQGRIAGIEITPGGDQPGMASTIRIRGQNSLRTAGNFPLYLIDGVPINPIPIESNTLLSTTGIDPLNTLNLSNIESIEVLKDADATAIYGSRGANGVILISTKKGIKKKTQVEVRTYSGISKVPNKLGLLNTKEYLKIRQIAFENDGLIPNDSNAPDLLLWDQNRNTDWQNFFFGKTSSVSDINIVTYGGNESTSFRIGGSYHQQGSVYIGDFNYNKLTFGLNLNNLSQNDKLSVNLSLNYGVDYNNLSGNTNLSSNVFRLTPNAPEIFNEDGSLHWMGWSLAGLDNPLQGYFNFSTTQNSNIVSQLGISRKLNSKLHFKTNFGYTKTTSQELVKIPKKSYNPYNQKLPFPIAFDYMGCYQ